MGVVAGADQEPVGPKTLQGRDHKAVHCRPVDVPAGPGRHGDIDNGPGRRAASRLFDPARARIERKLVEGDVEDIGFLVEHFLGSVPVMNIPIDDGHPPTLRPQPGRRYRNVVEEAEPHGPGS